MPAVDASAVHDKLLPRLHIIRLQHQVHRACFEALLQVENWAFTHLILLGVARCLVWVVPKLGHRCLPSLLLLLAKDLGSANKAAAGLLLGFPPLGRAEVNRDAADLRVVFLGHADRLGILARLIKEENNALEANGMVVAQEAVHCERRCCTQHHTDGESRRRRRGRCQAFSLAARRCDHSCRCAGWWWCCIARFPRLPTGKRGAFDRPHATALPRQAQQRRRHRRRPEDRLTSTGFGRQLTQRDLFL